MARPITYNPTAALDRAMDLFWSRGYQAVSVDDVVRDTGLNRHSLYANYGNKFGLLEAVLDQYLDVVLVKIRGILLDSSPPRTRIENLLKLRDPEIDDDFWGSMLVRGCLALRTASELRSSHPEIHKRVAGVVQDLKDLIADVIREGQEDGSMRRDRAADDLAAVTSGGFIAMLYFEPSPDMRGAFLSMLD